MSRPHIMIVEARFYEDIADALFAGACGALEDAGASHERFEVPGAFELPATIAFAHKTESDRFDGYVALDCVIRVEGNGRIKRRAVPGGSGSMIPG